MSTTDKPDPKPKEEESSLGVSGETPNDIRQFQKTVNGRLNAMTDRQDSIQALSLWLIHHKNQCQIIASCWLAAVKRGKTTGDFRTAV